MGLYPSTLFHFTNKEALYSILADNFHISYAHERIITPNEQRDFGVPMVSFCDLRLTELKSFIGSYGTFGVGLSKEWANEQGLNPVWYVNRHSSVMGYLFNTAQGLADEMMKFSIWEQPAGLGERYMGVMNSWRFVKNYKADLIRRDRDTVVDYCFADEREWRFVPDHDKSFIPPFAPGMLMKYAADKARFNRGVAHLRLTFTPDDIKYLVVERDADILPLVDHLNTVKSKNYPPDAVRRLTTRILTADQIRDDV